MADHHNYRAEGAFTMEQAGMWYLSFSVSAMLVSCLSVVCELSARNLRADLDHLDCSDTQNISHTPSKAKMIFEKKIGSYLAATYLKIRFCCFR